MASSRLERIGTIYSRVTGLLRSGAVKPESKPLWYDVYQHFPPKHPPKFDRPEPSKVVPNLFFLEDVIRARLNKENPTVIGTVNLSESKRLSNTQKCIEYYEQFKDEGANDDEAFKKAVEQTVSEMPIRKERSTQETPSNIAEEFKRSKNLLISKLFDKE